MFLHLSHLKHIWPFPLLRSLSSIALSRCIGRQSQLRQLMCNFVLAAIQNTMLRMRKRLVNLVSECAGTIINYFPQRPFSTNCSKTAFPVNCLVMSGHQGYPEVDLYLKVFTQSSSQKETQALLHKRQFYQATTFSFLP